jgi:hypothetical protein
MKLDGRNQLKRQCFFGHCVFFATHYNGSAAIEADHSISLFSRANYHLLSEQLLFSVLA